LHGGRLKRPTRCYSDEADEQTSVVVVPGVKSTKDEESIFITTSVTNKLNRKLPFVYLSPSLDRDGGAQFTYSFWFKTEPGSNFDTVLLFMRGDKTRADFINVKKEALNRVSNILLHSVYDTRQNGEWR
jgi:hypothetical protein